MNLIRLWRIRVLVALDACCFFAIWQLMDWEAHRLQEPWAGMAAYADHAWWEDRATLAGVIFPIALLWAIAGWIALCVHPKSGRWIYLGALTWYLGTILIMPPQLFTPLVHAVTGINWLLVGAMLAQCFPWREAAAGSASPGAPTSVGPAGGLQSAEM